MQAVLAMSGNWTIDGDEFVVLLNGDGQYSIWPSVAPIPSGWSSVGPIGSKAECLAFVETAWTDMRPVPLRSRTDRR
ncbi:MbtH family protein [Rhodopseudomonas sp. RCAM05734]|uniref:MbtH family protein n=1 Tax=Rhodopseudomonas sp. RCAM05734 TaxID=3457549 RepID=UPI00404459E2